MTLKDIEDVKVLIRVNDDWFEVVNLDDLTKNQILFALGSIDGEIKVVKLKREKDVGE